MPDAAFQSAVALADGLFPHQIDGVAFLLGRRRAILADDMGLGKTRQSIVSLRHLTPGGHRLVVCPASVKRNWAREIAVVAPDSTVLVIEGTAPAAPTAEWVVIRYRGAGGQESLELLAGKDSRPAPSRDAGLRRRGKLLAFLVEARQALASAKAAATLDFVRGAIEQGEKVIVFSCFDAPVQTLARELGAAAVVVTGKTPAAARQPLVDRFQSDPELRVLIANIIAGGTGLNLTAATQVVFNDLDWVPTNHWQAEDRAYRIGQTRTVHVTYFVARDTIDDFVQAVLETKAALVSAIVDGAALAPAAGGDVLDELQRVLHALPAGAGDPADGDDELIRRLLRQASDAFRTTHHADTPAHRSLGEGGSRPQAARSESEAQALVAALEGLIKVLSGPSARRFRIASTSHKGVEYEIVAVDADVTCSCPGFEYRGQCRHARDVKTALAMGQTVPARYAEVR